MVNHYAYKRTLGDAESNVAPIWASGGKINRGMEGRRTS